jgi:hypothetical protein
MMFQFFLDGNLVESATNWKDVSSTIKRDNQQNLFLLFQEYDLTFDSTGYDYLIDKIQNDSFCTEVVVEIKKMCDDDYLTIFNGILFISDCVVDERACTIKCKVNDKSFFSKINNNKNIKTSLDGAFTKLKQPITAIEQYDLEVFSVGSNSSVRTVIACRIEEAFRYFVDFMTESSVGFRSDTFGATGDWNGLCITVGERLRGVVPSVEDARWIPFSFLDLFNEINKRIPIVLLVEDPYTSPIVRIESIEYLFGNSVTFFASSVYEIETSFDTSKLYALVKMGSPTDDTFTLDFPEDIDYFGFKKEEFHLLSSCNLDQALDLSANWIVSSNIIQRVVDPPLDQGYDDNTFLINSIYTDDNTGRTTNDNMFNITPPKYHYNALLNNASIADRYIEDLSASLASYYVNSKEGQMYAYRNGLLQHTNLVNSEDFNFFLNSESFDFGNNFDTLTAKYTAPQTATYNIKAQVTIIFGNFASGSGNFGNYYQFTVDHYDSSNNLLNRFYIGAHNTILGAGSFAPGQYWAAGYSINTVLARSLNNQIINMNAGDYITMRIKSYPLTVAANNIYTNGQLYTILTNASQTFLEVVDTSITGGTFLDIDPNLIKVQLHKFSYPMTQQEFNGVLNNPTGRIGFAMENQPYRYGWIKELKYNHTLSKADFVLTTNRESEYAS